MSLINDAIKQASRTQGFPAASPIPAVPLEPVDLDDGESLISRYALPALLVVMLGVAAWAFWPCQNQLTPPANMAMAAPVVEQPAPLQASVEPAAVAGPGLMDRLVSFWAVLQQKISNQPAQPEEAKTATTFPELRLQGLFYRAKHPVALVNGHSVEMGDVLENAKVTQINRSGVTVEFRGETRTLTFSNRL